MPALRKVAACNTTCAAPCADSQDLDAQGMERSQATLHRLVMQDAT